MVTFSPCNSLSPTVTTSPSPYWWEEDETKLKIIYYGARYVWGIKYEMVPEKNYNWETWFKDKYKLSLQEFSVWANENTLRERFGEK